MPSAPRDLSRSGTLYSVLGVSADATPEEVRRAYRLLAHRLHPDRRRGDEKLRPGAAAAEFSIVSEAYEVLSDEGRRDIYDAIGMDGLRLYEWAQKINPPGPPPVLPPIVLASALCLGGAALALLLGASVYLAALRHDGSLSGTPWPFLFLPLLLANPLLLLLGGLLAAHGPSDRMSAILRLLPTILLLATFEVLLCLKLESYRYAEEHPLSPPSPFSSLSWLSVLAPLLVSRGAAIGQLPSELRAARRAAARSGGGDEKKQSATTGPLGEDAAAEVSPRGSGSSEEAGSKPSSTTTAGGVLRRIRSRAHASMRSLYLSIDGPMLGCGRQLVWFLLGSAQLSILPPRLEGLLLCSWWLFLLPLWIWLLFEAMYTMRLIREDEAARVRMADLGMGTGTPQQQLRRALRQGARGGWLGALLLMTLLLAWFAAKFDATEQGSAPALTIWSPLMLALLSFVSCVGCVCATAPSPRLAASRAWKRERDAAAAAAEPLADIPDGEEESEALPSTPRQPVAPPATAPPPPPDPLTQVPDEGDVDPSDVIRAAFAPTPLAALPGAMPDPFAIHRAARQAREEAEAAQQRQEEQMPLPDVSDWAEAPEDDEEISSV